MTDPVGLSPVGDVALALPDSPPLVANVVLVDPLTGPAASTAELPATADVTLYVSATPGEPAVNGEPAFTVTAISAGGIVFDLADGYSMTIDELQSAVFVANALTNESVRIWGAAEIQLDGAEAARFWGTTTVELGNGTKITLETAADALITDLFRLDKVTVTRDDRAMVITGVAETALGDVVVTQSFEGEGVDDATRDGLTLVTDLTGSWSDEYGREVTQDVLDQTAPGERYGPGKNQQSLREVMDVISRFVAYEAVGSLMLSLSNRAPSVTPGSDAAAGVRRALALYAADTTRLAVAP